MRRRRSTTGGGVREPSGRLARLGAQEDAVPILVKRLRDAALAGVAGEEWGSELGRLLLTGKIRPELYAAGRRWAACAVRYRAALLAPRPQAVRLGPRKAAAPPDPESIVGRAQAARDRAALADMRAARAALREAGVLAEQVVRSVCEDDRAPCGARESEALRRGLACLSRFWRMAGAT